MGILVQHVASVSRVVKGFASGAFFYQAGCFFLAISRLLQVVSFFLPLKILILLSSKKMPSYVEYIPFGISYDALLIAFIAMVPLTYVGYILSGVLHRLLLDRDLKRWTTSELPPSWINVSSNIKLVKLHGHVAKFLAEVILVAVSLGLVLLANPVMFVFLFSLIILNISIFANKAFYKSEHDRIGVFRLHRRQYIEYFSSVNFIFVFAVLVVQLKFSFIGVFEALFVLLISRMVFQAVQRFSLENIYISSYLVE